MKRDKSTFLYHSPCPNCGSRDNLGNWSDGHVYCFGCGYQKHGKQIKYPKLELGMSNETSVLSPDLPFDFTGAIPPEPMQWLLKYEVTLEEIESNNLGWSPSKGALIFPFYDGNKVAFWQGRIFSTDPRKPKYYTRGNLKDFIPMYTSEKDTTITRPGTPKEGSSVLFVEDCVSAIKCSRVMTTVPLFGCKVHPALISRNAYIYDDAYFWLDPDKQNTYNKFVGLAKLLYSAVYLIKSDKDPKDYTTEGIREFLNKPEKGNIDVSN